MFKDDLTAKYDIRKKNKIYSLWKIIHMIYHQYEFPLNFDCFLIICEIIHKNFNCLLSSKPLHELKSFSHFEL